MIEARDRLVRVEDPLTPFSNRRSGEGIWRDLGPERPFYRFSAGGSERNLFGSPLPVRSSLIGSIRSPSMAIQPSRGVNRVGFGTSRLGNNGRGWHLNGSSPSVGVQNIAPPGTNRENRGRVRNTPLPSWYPRTPLQDITAVVNAIERRRNRLMEAEHHRLGTPTPQELNILEDLIIPNTGAPLEHDISLASPNPTAIIKHCPRSVGPLQKILLGKQDDTDESDFLTPQKKLLNAIDVVEKVVLEEFRRIKRTPSAKKAEREKKVRTLMAMR